MVVGAEETTRKGAKGTPCPRPSKGSSAAVSRRTAMSNRKDQRPRVFKGEIKGPRILRPRDSGPQASGPAIVKWAKPRVPQPRQGTKTQTPLLSKCSFLVQS